MNDWTMVLVWGFGLGFAVIMLAAVLRRRRALLVDSLKGHVKRELAAYETDEADSQGDAAGGLLDAVEAAKEAKALEMLNEVAEKAAE